MNDTLMILAHPDIDKSIGNKIISEYAAQHNVTVRNIAMLYPSFEIDIEAEQQALLNASTIVFQYPLFWYNVPAILKHWIDQVFQYGFAFGHNGFKLANKNIVVSFTMGSSKKDYPEEILEKILFPFKGLSKYCKMNYQGEILSNNINNYTPEGAIKAKELAQEHAKKLVQLIH